MEDVLLGPRGEDVLFHPGPGDLGIDRFVEAIGHGARVARARADSGADMGPRAPVRRRAVVVLNALRGVLSSRGHEPGSKACQKDIQADDGKKGGGRQNRLP
jgi:hypothetical protein